MAFFSTAGLNAAIGAERPTASGNPKRQATDRSGTAASQQAKAAARTYALVAAQARKTRQLLRAGPGAATKRETQDCPDGGSITQLLPDDPALRVGTEIVTSFSQCGDAGSFINGFVRITVTSLDGPDGTAHDRC